jgi:hypothetical protein
LPSIEDNDAVDDLAERALAASIGPDQRQHLAGLNLQVGIGERDHAAVALDNVAGRKRYRHEFLLRNLATANSNSRRGYLRHLPLLEDACRRSGR